MKIVALAFLTFLTLFASNSALFENSKIIKEVLNVQEMSPIVLGVFDQICAVIFWHEECEKCAYLEKIVQQFAEDYYGLVQVYHIDCQVIWSKEEE